MVVDDDTAFVKSLNWETRTSPRPVTTPSSPRMSTEVNEIVDCFEADWNRKAFTPGDNAHLIWCREMAANASPID